MGRKLRRGLRGRRRIAGPRMVAVLPTLLTLGNAVCGFAAITFAAQVGPEPELPVGSELFIAAVLVYMAMIFDMLDGPVARWSRQTSRFGAQLDSLSDAISFGVAPAFIMLSFTTAFYHPRVLWVIAVLFMLSTILRLARFNNETGEEDSHESFSGLPSPAAAGMVASFPIAMWGLTKLTEPTMSDLTQRLGHWLMSAATLSLPVLTLALACLMVSRIRYPHTFNQWFQGRRSFQHMVQLIFSLVAVFAIRELALPLILLWFVFGSPVRALWTETLNRSSMWWGTNGQVPREQHVEVAGEEYG